MEIFNETYDSESLYDLERDISEAFDVDYNPVVKEIPVDEHGFQEGTFEVTIKWIPEDESK
jgi:hypothetical protein